MVSKVFVTGADGMLGNHVVRELLRQHYNVKAFVLPNGPVATLSNLNIEIAKGNILDLIEINQNISDCDIVIHIAASTSVWPTSHNAGSKVNIEGTKNVFEAALNAKVKKVIYVGTANSFGAGLIDSLGNENSVYSADKYHLDYMDSKREAQNVVESYKNKIHYAVINPTCMFGAYDSYIGSGAFIEAIYKGKIPFASPGGKNYVCAKDVAVGIVNAIAKGKDGECYITGNKNLSYKEAFEKIASTLGIKKSFIVMPKVLVLVYGFLLGLIGTVFSFKPKLSLPLSRIACDDHYYSSEKAIKELNLPQSPIEEGIIEAITWFKENKIV